MKKIEHESTEETNRKQDSLSRGRSYAPSNRQQRGYSKPKNNIKGKIHGKKPYQESSGVKPGRSPLSKRPLSKQAKCNGGYKAQVEKNRDQSKWKQYPSEGSRGQWEENQYHSQRSGGYLKKSHGQSERSFSYTKRSHGQSGRFHGQLNRFHGHSGRDHGHTERSRGHSERSYGHSERFYGHSERSYDNSRRSPMISEQYHDLPERSQFLSERSHGESERYHDQSGRYRRYSPVPLENDNNFNENDQGNQRCKRRITTLYLNSKCTATKSTLHQPKGIFLKYNFHAIGN
ncbi:Leucine zipper protein 4, partial [Galemys pyrenaicus]